MNYKMVLDALNTWQILSQNEILQQEIQRLQNFVQPNQEILNFGYEYVSVSLKTFDKLLNKLSSGQILINSNYSIIECSYIDNQIFKNCTPEFNQYAANQQYANQWYHIDYTDFNQLSKQEQKFLINNVRLQFFLISLMKNTKYSVYSSALYNTFQSSLFYSIQKTDMTLGSLSDMNCITDKKKFPYDPRCRDWYQGAIKSTDIFYTNPYINLNGKIGLSASIQIQDNIENTFQVVGFDITVENFIQNDFTSKNNDKYSILFDEDQNILYHQYYNTSSKQFLWSDLEYQNITTPKQQQDKANFQQALNQTINSLIYEDQNSYSKNNFFKFNKNDKEYYALILPVEYMKKSFLAHNKSSILFLGRVQNDLTTVINQANIANNSTLIIINMSGIFFIIVLNILAFVIFLIYQYYIIIIPLSALTTFLKEIVKQKEQSQEKLLNQQTKKTKNYNLKTRYGQNDRQTFQQIQIFSSRNNISSSQIASSQGLFFQNLSKESFHINKMKPKKPSENQSNLQVPSRKTFQYEASEYIEPQEIKYNGSMESLISQETSDEEEYSKLDLQNMVPFSLEIEIIKDTFLQLEQILNYTQSTNENTKSQDTQFLQIFKGIQIFKDIKNYFAIQKLYSQLARIYFNQNEYLIALQQFQSSLYYCLLDLGYGDEQMLWDSLNQGVYIQNQEKMYTLSIRYYMIAYCEYQILLKDNQFIQNYLSFQSYPEEQSLLKNSQEHIQKSLNILEKIQKHIQVSNNTQSISYVYLLACQISLLTRDQTTFQKYYQMIDINNQKYLNAESPQLKIQSQREIQSLKETGNLLIQNYAQQQIKLLKVIKLLVYKDQSQELVDNIKNIFQESQFIYPQLFSFCFHILKQKIQQIPEIQKAIEEEQLNVFLKQKYNFIIIIQVELYYSSVDIQKKIVLLQQLYERIQNLDILVTLIILSENQFETIQAQQPIQNARQFSLLMEYLHSKYTALKSKMYFEKASDFLQFQQPFIVLQNCILQSIIQLCSISQKESNNTFTQNIVIIDRLEIKQMQEKEYNILQNLQFFSQDNIIKAGISFTLFTNFVDKQNTIKKY
ncbi:transmembrane protein, putative (macronuclear) [Tetrahymena thermophila SB210]|uniref:Transmembrane protein, putative n=1 Tax=Tetrahymena thermophila (strain SB210) TaxID=312017 RepID=I7ME99_TETTS|nr:transmembrane protein, putative [Tetrahymena thermophila SB210]EAR95779.2 transmembrane protein, putative [Tetrahymena thermophila SB210]|eukprot:XP_001016024.2 transmembrane protein, putative [Tetrahymena thermophila SB210]